MLDETETMPSHDIRTYSWFDVFCSDNCCSSRRLWERKNSQSSRSIFWRKFIAVYSHSVLHATCYLIHTADKHRTSEARWPHNTMQWPLSWHFSLSMKTEGCSIRFENQYIRLKKFHNLHISGYGGLA